MTALPQALLYPIPNEAALRLHYVGTPLRDIPAPAVVLDVAVIRRNCKYMLDAVKALGVGFRAHVKTHKVIHPGSKDSTSRFVADDDIQTNQLTQWQVGKTSNDIRLVVSTVAELEHLSRWLLRSKQQGKAVSVVHGLPIVPSAIPRLARIAHLLGPGSVTVLVDHPSQIMHLATFASSGAGWPGHIPIMIKVDTGYHRAGVPPTSEALSALTTVLAEHAAHITLAGIYTHQGHSYGSSSPTEALGHFHTELTTALSAAKTLFPLLTTRAADAAPLTISMGATPTTSAAQLLTAASPSTEAVALKELLDSAKAEFDIELHAGVYPLLDMQQLATQARPTTLDGTSRMALENVGTRVLVEVASLYEREKPEALVAAGSIVLGREVCKSYPGWGVVSSWRDGRTGGGSGTVAQSGTDGAVKVYDPLGEKTGWIIGRISQEHGILTWEGGMDGFRPLSVGEKLLVYPNHACMAGPNFGWYFIVDGDVEGGQKVVDVWVRCRGW